MDEAFLSAGRYDEGMSFSRHRVTLAAGFLVAGCLAAVVFAPGASGAPRPATADGRIVAIGDIHGAHDALLAILQEADLVDDEGHWVGGETTLVQTGDFTDRGPQERRVMDLLMRLQQEAADAGARMEVLLANHEAFNLVGYYRDTGAAGFETFATPESEERRREAWERVKEFRRRRAQELDQPEPTFGDTVEQEWLDAHPLGFFERMEAFGPNGRYGEWLRERPAVREIDGMLFVHGGISPQIASWDRDRINRRLRDEIQLFDETKQWMVDEGLALPFFGYTELVEAADAELTRIRAEYPADGRSPPRRVQRRIQRLQALLQTPNWFLLHENGPLWFRGLAQWPQERQEEVRAILDEQGVDHIIVAHTTQFDGKIRVRFGGRVFLIDTGMLSEHYEGGQASALIIEDGRFDALYLDGREALLPAATSAPGSPVVVRPVARQANPDPGADASPDPSPALDPEDRRYLGPDGQPLPFDSEDQVLEFLATAEVVSMQPVGQGITGARRVTLEREGVRARAIFHTVHQVSERERIEDRFFVKFYDSWRSQCATYALARLLGIRQVPPTVQRRIDAETGSLQLWIEGEVMTNTDRIRDEIQPPDLVGWMEQVWVMQVFDNVIYNDDRNTGNVLIDSAWNLWLIDHTRAFQETETLREPGRITHYEKHLWELLRDTPDQEIRRVLQPYLEPRQISDVLVRRRAVVQILEDLVDERGESAVLFRFRDRRHEVGPAPPASSTPG